MIRQLQSTLHNATDTIVHGQKVRHDLLTALAHGHPPIRFHPYQVNPITLDVTEQGRQPDPRCLFSTVQANSSHDHIETLPPSGNSACMHDYAVLPEQILREDQAVFVLPSTEEVVFNKKIPLCNPPAVHYLSQISQLFMDWYNSDLVRINGRGVPIKSWDVLYKTYGKGQWSTSRNKWGNWKVHALVFE